MYSYKNGNILDFSEMLWVRKKKQPCQYLRLSDSYTKTKKKSEQYLTTKETGPKFQVGYPEYVLLQHALRAKNT